MNHKPQVMSGRQIQTMIFTHDECSRIEFRQFFDANGDHIEGIESQIFVAEWPEHCTTMQHLSDATIHGPYESESEAMSCHDGAELY